MVAQVRRRHLFASFTMLFPVVLLTAAAEAQNPRAGTVKWPINAEKVGVILTKPMPSTKYSVAVMPYVPKLGGYSPTSVCTYFGIATKSLDSFVVYHRRCDTGALVKVDEPFELDWIIAEHTQ